MLRAIVIRLFPNREQNIKMRRFAGAARWDGGLPRFKAKGQSIPSFCTRSEHVYTKDGRIYLEKIGHVRYKSHLDLSGVRFRNARVKFENGKWLLKAAVELDAEAPTPTLRDCALGVDVGVKSLAVVSMSDRKRVFKNINRTHKVRRLVRQLKHHQRALARKQKGSANRLKERVRVRELYGRLKRIRHDYIEKVTRVIVNMRSRVIVLEDLNISGMMENSHLARAVAEQNLYLFRQLLERKAQEAGIAVKFAGSFFPSSKTCSGCGHVREKLRLDERVFKCPVCGLEIDRDYNAAINLERLAY